MGYGHPDYQGLWTRNKEQHIIRKGDNMKTMSYYIYNEWQHSGHLQLVQKTKNYQKLDFEYLKQWRGDKKIFHLVKANHWLAAHIVISKHKYPNIYAPMPNGYEGQYIKEIRG